MSFEVAANQVVALVGPSGGGKSTIVSMIERFYLPDAGQVLVGGLPLERLDPTWVKQHVALVSQEPVLFAVSIADNIRYGRATATAEEVMAAAKQVRV